MYLEELDEKAIEEYARKWYSANPRLTGNEKERIATDFLRDSETVSDLRANPLLLSLMCNIYKGAGYIPQNRADLYERCATMLFDEWDQSRGIESGGPLRGDAHLALQDIAYWAITEPILATGIPEVRLKRRLTDFLTRLDMEMKATRMRQLISCCNSGGVEPGYLQTSALIACTQSTILRIAHFSNTLRERI